MKFASIIRQGVITIGFLSAAWLFAAFISHAQGLVPAPQNPPSNNTPEPIHVGSANQIKEGSLSVGSVAVDPEVAIFSPEVIDLHPQLLPVAQFLYCCVAFCD